MNDEKYNFQPSINKKDNTETLANGRHSVNPIVILRMNNRIVLTMLVIDLCDMLKCYAL